MKTTVIAGVLASFAGLIAACTSTIEVRTTPDGGVAVPEAGAEDGSTIEKDAGTDAPVAPKSCGVTLAPVTCPSLAPAPTSSTAISKFVKDGAVPLRCGGEAGTAQLWDLSPLVGLYGDNKIFMIGEVHGTNEIGIMSSLVLDQLAAKKLVNVVAFEMPMDIEDNFQRYVDTGSDPMAASYLTQLAPNMFGNILTRTARAQKLAGNSLKIGAVDIPFEIDGAAAAIQEIATRLTSQAQKDSVLLTLPTSTSQPPTPTDITKANAYFDHITSSKTAICAELTAADCDRLVAMTHAIWATTNTYDMANDSELWFARREEVIFYNMKQQVTKATDRMFLHMGAAHTNKYEFSGGSRMTHEYALTKDKVFSVAPAYGNGSVIWYGEDMDLPGEPTTLTGALTDAPANPFFVSTTRPSKACEKNPFGLESEQGVGVGGTRADLYDGYIHYGKLTSERRPKDTTFSRDIAVAKDGVAGAGVDEMRVARMVEFRAKLHAKETAALRAGGFAKLRNARH